MNSVEKALSVLMAFAGQNRETGTAALSKELGFHTSTVNRILLTLAKQGFLQQNPQTKKFTLGPSIYKLGSTALRTRGSNLMSTAIPYLESLCEKVGETVILEVIVGKHGVIAYVAEGKPSYRIAARVGERVPTHAAAGAKAIIAFFDPKTRETFLRKRLVRYNANTITDAETFATELERIRERGISFTREEIDLGINAIAAPVFDSESKPVAAVVIVGPTGRVRCEIDSAQVEPLKKCSVDLSRRLLNSEAGAT
jgi:IclR family transcriptional regulator, KDG regulon repressor